MVTKNNKQSAAGLEFEKIMKLSPIFSEHSSKYTKKMQKQILSIFDNN